MLVKSWRMPVKRTLKKSKKFYAIKIGPVYRGCTVYGLNHSGPNDLCYG
jgi:hypothetical protein